MNCPTAHPLIIVAAISLCALRQRPVTSGHCGQSGPAKTPHKAAVGAVALKREAKARDRSHKMNEMGNVRSYWTLNLDSRRCDALAMSSLPSATSLQS